MNALVRRLYSAYSCFSLCNDSSNSATPVSLSMIGGLAGDLILLPLRLQYVPVRSAEAAPNLQSLPHAVAVTGQAG